MLASSPARLRAALLLLSLTGFVQWLDSGSSLMSVASAQEAAAPPASPAPPAPPPNPAEAGSGESRSYLSWIIESSGWIGGVILLLSIYFVAMAVRQFMELRQATVSPPELIDECEELLKNKDYQGLYKLVRGDDSMLASLLTAGLTDLQHGLPEAREAMDRAAELAVVNMEKNISMMAVLGTLGPMIGLLGTLKGMIASFSVIALSDTQLKASEVAGGISEALLLTFEGVALSVPAIYFFALFKNRISVYSTEAMLTADLFIRRLYSAHRGKGSAEAGGQS